MPENDDGVARGRVLSVLLAAVVALVALCGWLGYRGHREGRADETRALLVQTAKQGAVNLTTIDYRHADEDAARILDSSTGEFHEDFKSRSGPFIEVVKKVKSESVGTVTEAGLESGDDRAGRVLVAVTVRTTKNGVPDEQPRYWRIRMTISRTPDGAKVSKVDFVP